jgi:hypothetical protein
MTIVSAYQLGLIVSAWYGFLFFFFFLYRVCVLGVDARGSHFVGFEYIINDFRPRTYQTWKLQKKYDLSNFI